MSTLHEGPPTSELVVDLVGELSDRHPLIFGSAGWGDLSQEECGSLLDVFVERGGSVIDTARVYGGGRSEAAIGAWLQHRRPRADMFVITKGGHPGTSGEPRVRMSDIRHDIELSLRALDIDRVDLFLMHRDAPELPVEDLCATLLDVQRCGLARYVGVSNWSASRVREAATHLGSRAWGGLAALSNYFGLAVPPPLPALPGATSAHEMAFLRELDRPMLLAWGALNGGYFSRQDADGVASYWDTRENALRRATLHRVARDANVGTTALLVRWLSGLPRLRPIVGTTNPGHLDEIMRAAQDVRLDAAVDALIQVCTPGTAPGSGRLLLVLRPAAGW